MKLISKFAFYGFLFVLSACVGEDIQTPTNNQGGGQNINGWDIPISEVFDGGPGKDGIPALENSVFIGVNEVDFLADDDLVLGVINDGEIKAYPHAILDWHEIINDKVGDLPLAVTYCPLTGTGIGWDRTIRGEITTFGVSGLLYNANLIPYDRLTDSNWSQMRLDCVNGVLRGESIPTYSLVETSWATWKAMFPDSRVVSTQTGYSRNYSRYPYGDYKTNNQNIIFPVKPEDSRLPAKERVHCVINGDQAMAFRFTEFAEGALYNEVFGGDTIVVAGSQTGNFIQSYINRTENGQTLDLQYHHLEDDPSVIMSDSEGNLWNLFGVAVSGPREGQRLEPTVSYMGYWFAVGAFFPELEIFNDNTKPGEPE